MKFKESIEWNTSYNSHVMYLFVHQYFVWFSVPKSRNSTSAKPSEDKRPWQITAAVSVERIPSISPPLPPIAEKMQKMLDSIEFELSKKSDHEMRHEEDQ